MKTKFPSLPTPFSTTLMKPVVAVDGTSATIWVLLQLVTVVAAAPLNRTELVPCDAPKYEPEIVTGTPIPPPDGEIPVISAEVPGTIETLSKVAVARAEVVLLVTAKPM